MLWRDAKGNAVKETRGTMKGVVSRPSWRKYCPWWKAADVGALYRVGASGKKGAINVELLPLVKAVDVHRYP